MLGYRCIMAVIEDFRFLESCSQTIVETELSKLVWNYATNSG